MLLKDPYKSNLFKETPYAKKVSIEGNLVVVLRGSLENRGLELINPISRVVNRGEVHELILTNDKQSGPGKKVDNISYVGFVEIDEPGVIVVGDRLKIGEYNIGKIVGFDETHAPNHLNIVVFSETIQDGESLGLELRTKVTFLQ